MPYLRLYSRHLPIEQKRVIAQELIEITLRAFHLCASDRYQISIQFITLPKVSGVEGPQASIPRDADFTLEVLSHDLTEEQKSAFVEESSVMLTHLLPVKPRRRIAHVFGILGIKLDGPPPIAVQFHDLSPAVSEPFVLHSERLAA